MPQPNNTLEAQLLQRATSIGPDKPMEAINNAEPMRGEMPGAPDDLVFDLIRGGWTKLRPAITTGKPIEAMLEMLGSGLKGATKGRVAEEMPEITKATGLRVPPTTFIESPVKQLEYPHEMPMRRSPDSYERLAQQRQADARIKATGGPVNPMTGKKLISQDSRAYSGARTAVKLDGTFRGKLNPDSVKAIRQAASSGIPFQDITAKYPGVHPETIRGVIARNSWTWVK